jgi:hypothetical protein
LILVLTSDEQDADPTSIRHTPGLENPTSRPPGTQQRRSVHAS